MFKSVRELKAFVTWATKNHVKRVKVDNVEIEISDLAFIPELNPPKLSQKLQKQAETDQVDAISTKLTPDTEEDDKDLYWSVTN